MSRTGWSPGTVPYGADQTVYLVIDRLSSGSVYRETEVERTDLETMIDDFLTGQFNDPVRVVAFNTLEHWANDVSKDIAQVIQARCDIAGDPSMVQDRVAVRSAPAVGGGVRGAGGWRDDDVALRTAVGPGGEVVRRVVHGLR